MPEVVYNTVAGFVEFDPVERTISLSDGDKTVTDVTIQAIGSGGKNVKVTLWEKSTAQKGDFLAAKGKFQVREVNGTEYISLSANHFMIFADDTIEGERDPF